MATRFVNCHCYIVYCDAIGRYSLTINDSYYADLVHAPLMTVTMVVGPVTMVIGPRYMVKYGRMAQGGIDCFLGQPEIVMRFSWSHQLFSGFKNMLHPKGTYAFVDDSLNR